MVSRREVLAMIGSAPFVGGLSPGVKKGPGQGIEFVEEGHGLARESASGFRLLVGRPGVVPRPAACVVAPGICEMNARRCSELLDRVRSGARVVIESGVGFSGGALAQEQARVLNEGLGLRVLASIPARGYVEYTWPTPQLVRTFEFVTPVDCAPGEVIAGWQGVPVCFRRRVGRGTLVYLGSMLGPGLFAEEREALGVGRGLIG